MEVYKPHAYQVAGFHHCIKNRYAGLFMDMGLGKTVISLTVAEFLLYQDAAIDRVLVIAPLQVAKNVWTKEQQKWEHLKHLKMSVVTGTEHQRVNALHKKADIYIINRENVAWLTARQAFNFDMVIVDESSSFKNHDSVRFKALRMVRPNIGRVVILTGTPAPNGLTDLWAQVYLLDQGVRLEKTISQYRTRYFAAGATDGHAIHGFHVRKDCSELIYEKIGDICKSLKKEDYLDLPPLIENDVIIELPEKIQKQYKEFEKEQVMKFILDEDEMIEKNIVALSRVALINKLLQYANGMVYDDQKQAHFIHDEKMSRLSDIIDEAQGQPVLIFYNYQFDLDRIQKKFGAVKLETTKQYDDWNAGKIPIMIAHPASAGYGLNLQDGGNIIVWFGLTWNLEHYLQGVTRIHRQGVKRPVIVHRILCEKTYDMRVLKSIRVKDRDQKDLIEGIKMLVDEYRLIENP